MRVLVFLFAVVFAVVTFNSNSGGRAAVKMQGNTGAPGDSRRVCKSCHSGNVIQVAMSIELLDSADRVISEYIPEQEYTVKVKVEPTAGDPKAFGFQMVCLDAELGQDGSDIKNWINDSKKVYHIADASNGRTYVEHDKPNRAGGIFKVKWKAPAKGTGTLSFYAAGNGVNLNGSTTGDGATKTSLEVKEATDNSVSDLSHKNRRLLLIQPNPVSERAHIKLQGGALNLSSLRISILDMLGNVVLDRPYSPENAIDVYRLIGGMYLVRLTSDNKEILASSLMYKL